VNFSFAIINIQLPKSVPVVKNYMYTFEENLTKFTTRYAPVY